MEKKKENKKQIYYARTCSKDLIRGTSGGADYDLYRRIFHLWIDYIHQSAGSRCQQEDDRC